jgi:hypothetical protein
MSLIPSFSFLELAALVPSMIVLWPFVLPTLKALMSNPLVSSAVNATLVVLETTEVVWRPAYNMTLVLAKEVIKAIVFLAPILKSLILTTVNVTVAFFRKAQAMGVSFATAFPTVMVRIKELGEALVVIGRTLGLTVYYMVKGLGFILGSVEYVLGFGKQLLFEPHLLTAQDLYNVMLPFAVVFTTLAMVYWFRKAPQPRIEAPMSAPVSVRRSSRLARKRAMMYAQDLSDAFPSCKKSSATATNL